MNYKLNTGAGDNFSTVAKQAKEIAKSNKCVVEFDFNGIKCLVKENTVLDWLDRDFTNAFIMDWKEIGPDCKMSYDVDTEIELYTRRLKRAKERKLQQEQQKIEDNIEKSKVDNATNGIELQILEDKTEEYKAYVSKNSNDGYSRGVVDYAEAWGKLMQVEISKGKSVKECADETQKPLGYLGITGFMYGCAVQALAHFWIHGEELRKWHNKEYNHEGEGVVNPAVMTLSV